MNNIESSIDSESSNEVYNINNNNYNNSNNAVNNNNNNIDSENRNYNFSQCENNSIVTNNVVNRSLYKYFCYLINKSKNIKFDFKKFIQRLSLKYL